MDANDDKGNLGGYLLQLKKAVSKLPTRTGGHVFLSSVAAFFVGTGTLGNLPPIALSQGVESRETAEETPARPKPAPDTEEELCLWQRDLAFFSRLEGDETELGRSISDCHKKAEEKKTEGGPVRPESGSAAIIRDLVAGYPIEAMTEPIAKYDRDVAGLIIGIAKKESNWGKRVPRAVDGSDCFNYWGYKGAGSRGIAMGHGCFGSPEEAVQAIGDRLTELVAIRSGSDPKNMIVWKCGSSCAGHSPESVTKWISDVSQYYHQIARP